MGRTARGEGARGRALLFLIPEELQFLKYLRAAKVPLNEYEFPENKIAKVQPQLVSGSSGGLLVATNRALIPLITEVILHECWPRCDNCW